MAQPTAKAVIVKKKKWVQIVAPKLFNEQMIGESFVGEVQELVGRNVTVSLMVLTGDPQKQTTSVSFKITGINKDAATTELVGYKMLPAAAKKLMRRKRNKIDDSFIVETQDKKIVRIKPLVVTRGHTTGAVMASMRKLARAYVAKMIATADFDNLIRDVVQKKLQHGLGQMLRRLYPIGACEIRQLELIPNEKVKELGLKITLPPDNLPEFKQKEVPKEEPKEQVESKEEPVQADEVAQGV